MASLEEPSLETVIKDDVLNEEKWKKQNSPRAAENFTWQVKMWAFLIQQRLGKDKISVSTYIYVIVFLLLIVRYRLQLRSSVYFTNCFL